MRAMHHVGRVELNDKRHLLAVNVADQHIRRVPFLAQLVQGLDAVLRIGVAADHDVGLKPGHESPVVPSAWPRVDVDRIEQPGVADERHHYRAIRNLAGLA